MAERVKSIIQSAVSRALGMSSTGPAVDKTPAEYSLIAGKYLPVYIDNNRIPRFKPQRASLPHRAFIITVPKSGTYLITRILADLGIVDCGVHIATDHLQDNRFADEKVLRLQAWKYIVWVPYDISTRLIDQGQFSFGHIPYSGEAEKILQDFKKVFTFRELRDVIVSLVRYYDSREQNYTKPEKRRLYEEFKAAPMGNGKFKAWYAMWGKEYTDLIRIMFPWKERSDVFRVKFETLMGDDGREAQFALLRELGASLDMSLSDDLIEKSLKDSIGADTLTYSGRRSVYGEWWNDELEDLFRSYGFDELNKIYGYE